MQNKPSWKIRRRIVIATLLFCAGEILYLTAWAESTQLAETIASGVLILAGSVIGSYVFGAVWDDRNVMQARTRTDDFPPPPGGPQDQGWWG
jgi:DMSO reductase anchor subunit